MWFIFKIPMLQRLSFPIRKWESFTLNFRLIQTTWVWNLAPETFQTEGLGAIWQDAALQNVMASLIFLSSQANSSPKPYCQLSTRHTSPSPSPLLGWGACGDSESTSGMAGSHHCYFPFSTLSADVAQSLMSCAFGIQSQVRANCPRTGSICNAIIFLMSAPLELKIPVRVYFSV